MDSIFSKIPLVPTLCLILFISLSSCASLSESECKAANWEIIGLEDGSQGKRSSHIGKHRKACSDYNIAPDLDAYLKGHQSGLTQFCTEQNGYNQGARGQANSNVCPTNLARNFNRGYQVGYNIYLKRAEISRLQKGINSHEHRLHEIEDTKVAIEEEIISSATSEYHRRELLEEVKALERESEALYYEIHEMRTLLIRLEEEFRPN